MTLLPGVSAPCDLDAPQRILFMGRDLDHWRRILGGLPQGVEPENCFLLQDDEQSPDGDHSGAFQVALVDYETLSPFQFRMMPALKGRMPGVQVLMCVEPQNAEKVLRTLGDVIDDCVLKSEGFESLLPERLRWVRRKAAEGQALLDRSLHLFQEAQKMQALGILASGIAHDFNNVLSMVFGHTQMALMALPPDSPLRNHLTQALTAGNRAKELVRDIFNISRQEKGTVQRIQAGTVIKEAVKFLRASIPSSIRIHQDLQLQPPGWDTLQCDPTHLYQIFINLCTNSVNAIGPDQHGNLTIELFLHQVPSQEANSPGSPAPGRYAALKVSDDGRGMSGEIKSRIFDTRFATMDNPGSTGMGLAIVKNLLRVHGGTIAVDSEPGRGTSVTVLLPCVERIPPVTSKDDGESIPTGSGRVLLVDDEDMLVQVGQLMLGKLGYEVAGYTDSVEALKSFEAEPESFDLVLTDLTMPNLSGFDLVRKLLDIRPDLPIIVCTGCGDGAALERLEGMGVRGFLRKPFIIKLMAQTIKEALD